MGGTNMPIDERLRLLSDEQLDSQPKLLKLVNNVEVLWAGEIVTKDSEGLMLKTRVLVISTDRIYVLDSHLHHVKASWPLTSISKAYKNDEVAYQIITFKMKPRGILKFKSSLGAQLCELLITKMLLEQEEQ